MGKLSEYAIPTEVVDVPGKDGAPVFSFTVRGISFADVSALIRRHGQALNSVYATAMDSEDGISPEIVSRALMEIAPQAATEIIGLATGEDNIAQASKNAARLPLIVQFDALHKIAVLTFHSEAELKKAVEAATSGMGLLMSLVTNLMQPKV